GGPPGGAVAREELELQLKEKKERVEEINFEFSGMRFTDEVRAEWNELNGDIDDLEETIREVAAREERIRRFADDESKVERIEMPQVSRPGVVKGEDIYDMSTVRRSWDDPTVEGRELHDRALRAIDLAVYPQQDIDPKTHLEQLVARIDNDAGQFSRSLLATGSMGYRRAFSKY